MNGEDQPAPEPSPSASNPAVWLREGWRSARGRRVRWDVLHAGPALIAGLLLAAVLLGIGMQRLMVSGSAQFWWQALAQGWWPGLVTVWLCWVVSRRRPTVDAAPGAATLFALLQSQGLAIAVVCGAATIAVAQVAPSVDAPAAAWSAWAIWWAWLLWSLAAAGQVLWRAAAGHRALRGLVVAAIACNGVIEVAAPPAQFWYPVHDDAAQAPAADRPRLTQQIVEAQPSLLDAQLRALAPQRAGVVDLYAITFAPYAGEDVFRRESEMVSSVLADRFDAAGRTLQLVNSEQTMQRLAWATPLNLRRAIDSLASRMDRDEDVLLIHLASHGARDGQLAAGAWPPFAFDPLTPAELRSWLDAAGLRWRVVTVSACYSGSWIAPLAGPDSLVMTASDAEHTSYGCGRRSELTFFGRALYDEQLRTQTRSFEKALAAARPLIEQRERDAGKDDGYSNPQIAVGDAVSERLQQLEARLESAASR